MIQLKLKLNSSKPSTVYSLNGKSYRLVPGTNVLSLEYDDYVSLAKALSIKPVDRQLAVDNSVKDHAEEPVKEEPIVEEPVKEEPVVDDCRMDSNKAEEDPCVNNDATNEDESSSELDAQSTDNSNNMNDPEESKESLNEAIDYSSWSYTKLKSEYKRVTGNVCKLKKEEVIAFLQENANNAE